jgi:hypothetical protein
MLQDVTLRDTHDEGGSRHLRATLKSDGSILIEGQDIGSGVESVFGPGLREYEWTWLIRRSEVRTLKLALGSSGDVLVALRDRFAGEAAVGLQSFLEENGVRYEPWSRVGE